MRSRLSDKFAHRVDPEDVVQSAYRSFFDDTRGGRYEVERGGDLWRLLVTITLHKLQYHIRGLRTQKRAVEHEQNFGTEDSLHGLQAHVAARDPSPVEAVALADQLEQIMRALEPSERRMLELRLQGHNMEEIAGQTAISERTVRRFLKRIKGQLERWPSENFLA